MANPICTVGHSTRTFAEVVAMLRAHEVTCLVDVRSYPSSRAFPQWNQDAIIEALPADIDYRWIANLGGRRHTAKGVASPNGAWRVKAFRDYADYMGTEKFKDGLDELLATAEHALPAIMCSEAVPWRCHRRLISDALIVEGIQVVDILSATSSRTAALNPGARVRDGHLVYPTAF